MKKVIIKKLGVMLKLSDDEFKKAHTTDLYDKDTGKFLYKAKTINFQEGNIYMIINENLFEEVKEND